MIGDHNASPRSRILCTAVGVGGADDGRMAANRVNGGHDGNDIFFADWRCTDFMRSR